ncbi:hypothetical protein [Devriesea agamarum]|uniref:hypothetical protein n=1 Tax=Devriesea agamarum TaxID=472569 RepID=UPI0012EEA0D6|nr:hypothetical protein [Devriesea agamarum]
MMDKALLMAEASHAAEGLPPIVYGVGTLVVLLALLGITFLFSGLTDKDSPQD